MQSLNILAVLFLGIFMVLGKEFDSDQIVQMQNVVEGQLLLEYPNVEQAFKQNSENEKKQLLSDILQTIANPVLSRQWTHPSGIDWPLVDWPRVMACSPKIEPSAMRVPGASRV